MIENVNMSNKINCPHCKKDDIVKRGSYQTAVKGKVQRYYCKNCDKKFVLRGAFYRMRNTPKKITLCLDLFFKGVSTRKIQEHLQAFYPHNSSNVSIYKWIVRYSEMISRFTDKLSVKSGTELMCDEMEYHRLGKKNWFTDIIDTKTRFLVSSEYMEKRTNEALTDVLKSAKKKTGNQVKIVTTDGLMNYPVVLKKSFCVDKKRTVNPIVKHNIVNASAGEGFNHKIERLHNTIRQFTKNFRGFHGSVKSAYAIMKGFEVNYNFIRKHLAIGKCPCELAIPELKFEENKWLELINFSVKN